MSLEAAVGDIESGKSKELEEAIYESQFTEEPHFAFRWFFGFFFAWQFLSSVVLAAH